MAELRARVLQDKSEYGASAYQGCGRCPVRLMASLARVAGLPSTATELTLEDAPTCGKLLPKWLVAAVRHALDAGAAATLTRLDLGGADLGARDMRRLITGLYHANAIQELNVECSEGSSRSEGDWYADDACVMVSVKQLLAAVLTYRICTNYWLH